MLPTPWTRMRTTSPFETFDEVRREMDRIFDAVPAAALEARTRLLPADVRETGDALEVEMEIPGLRPEDIELTVENNVLTIAGEKKVENREGSEDSYRLLERRYGRFERSFRVPGNVKAEDVSANYRNGVLHVTLPKTEESRPRRIRVESGDNARQVTSG